MTAALILSRLSWSPCSQPDPGSGAGLRGLELLEQLRQAHNRLGEPADAWGVGDPGSRADAERWPCFHDPRSAGTVCRAGPMPTSIGLVVAGATLATAAERTSASALALTARLSPASIFGIPPPRSMPGWGSQQAARPVRRRFGGAIVARRWNPSTPPGWRRDCRAECSNRLRWLRQFQEGHGLTASGAPSPGMEPTELAWLPRQLRLCCRLAAGGAATGVRWFCTPQAAWKCHRNPFPIDVSLAAAAEREAC